MSKRNDSDTRVSLREYVDALFGEHGKRTDERAAASQRAIDDAFRAQEKLLDARLLAAQDAVEKANVANEKRFDGVNEFRSSLGDQQRTLMPRSEVEVIVKSLNDKVEAQNKLIQSNADNLRELIANRAGVGSGWGYAVGAVGLILGVAGLALAVLKP